MDDRSLLEKIGEYKTYSENTKTHYTERWRKNMKLIKGSFPDDEVTKSKVRKRSKIFFRKIWSNNWRMLASLYQAFLKDPDAFDYEARDTVEDPDKARVLKEMARYRRDKMMREDDLFIKILWAFSDILDLGWAPAKLTWEYDEKTGKDGPKFVCYPVEQVFPDFNGTTPKNMQFCIYENYMSKDDMEAAGYENIEKAEPTGPESDPVRSTRFEGERDPMQNPGKDEYPRPGKYDEGDKESTQRLYKVWECFYKKDGKWMFCVTNASKCVLKQPEESVYKKIPGLFGQCLLRAHKLIGEGFPEPLEGPQESYNANLNQRKDNVALSLNPMKHVSRFGNVDLQSLVNSRAGGVVLMDDTDSVIETKPPDVTQSSYVEANEDEKMMNEMGGITPQRMGMGEDTKATVAQINFTESNAKIELFLAIVGETFMKEFYGLLGELIQRFETDENIFRITNQKLKKDKAIESDVYDLDFDADIILEVGQSVAGKELEFKQLLNTMDRANQHNNLMVGMLEKGLAPPEGITFANTAVLFKESLKLIGKKNFKEYFFKVPPPQQQGQGGQDPAMAGKAQPQIGGQIPMIDNGGEGGAIYGGR